MSWALFAGADLGRMWDHRCRGVIFVIERSCRRTIDGEQRIARNNRDKQIPWPRSYRSDDSIAKLAGGGSAGRGRRVHEFSGTLPGSDWGHECRKSGRRAGILKTCGSIARSGVHEGSEQETSDLWHG